MCCFSQPVRSVRATNIFARAAEENRQFLVYSISIEARSDLAMILPLPVKTPAAEKDVRFVDLKQYPEFFRQMRLGFPFREWTGGGGGGGPRKLITNSAPLEVVQVGDFEASFVPAVKDFARLDERFRLPSDAWKELPQYLSYGFAVFKLKPGAATIHPMAFSFPRRDRKSLFFPTVHIHDGKVHSKADFDHALYCQAHPEQHLQLGGNWEESRSHPTSFMRVDKTKGVVLANQHCYKRELHGNLPNEDTQVAVETL